MSPQTILNPSFEAWEFDAVKGGVKPVSWTRVLAGATNINLVTNGDFATDDLTGWTAAAGWSGTTGKAVHTAGIADTTPLTQNISLANTKVYRIRVKLSGRTAGTLSMALENVAEGPFAIGPYSDGTIFETDVTATATDATSLLSFTPSATFNGSVDDISVRDMGLSDIRRAGHHDLCDEYPSLDAVDIAVDNTPNAVSSAGVLTLVPGNDYHLYFSRMMAHDDPAIVEGDAHYGTVQIKTHDASLYLQADLTWGAGAYSFPLGAAFAKDRFSKRFMADPGDTSYLVTFSSNDLHGSAGYHKHLYIDNFHCEDVTIIE